MIGGESTYSRILDANERAAVEGYISRFYPTFRELSDVSMSQAAFVTVHGTCYKSDVNTILSAEMKDGNPLFGSL